MKATKKTTKATTAPRSEHGKATITFSKQVDKLEQHYRAPAPPSTDPLEPVIWESITYLASDKRRAEAFAIIKRTIGTLPDQILAAPHSASAAVGKAVIRVRREQDESASLVLFATVKEQIHGTDRWKTG